MTTKTSRNLPARRRPLNLAAALLASSRAASVAAETPQHASFLNRYEPSTNVDSLAALDLDQRSIEASLDAGTYAGLREAEEIYSTGRVSDSAALPTANGNRTTLQGLNWEAMGMISGTYETFVEYYGGQDYADRWIQAAFDGIATGFHDGNADFSKLDLEGRSAAIQHGTVALNVWINVVGRIEMAADFCVENAGKNDAEMAEWDGAVALYAGSLAREGGGDGHLLYALAQDQCAEFGTCGEGELAPVNDMLFEKFSDGKERLQLGHCRIHSVRAKRIRSLMTVPLVQGLLRAAYALDVEDDLRPATRGEGAAFAASVLPLLDECDSGDAEIVREDLAPGKESRGDFRAVKAALERNYKCLGVACADVGEIVNAREGVGAEACGEFGPAGSDAEKKDQSDEDENDSVDAGSQPIQPQSTEADDEGHGFDGMDVADAAMMSGLAFGIFGFIMGAGVAAACRSRSMMEKKEAEVEFVTSSNTSVDVD